MMRSTSVTLLIFILSFTKGLAQTKDTIAGSRRNINAIKTGPVSPLFNVLVLGYERCVGEDRNLCLEAGYVNSTINPKQYNGFEGSTSTEGGYLKLGIKFVIREGREKAERLNGFFIRPDFCFTSLTYRNSIIDVYGSTNIGPMTSIATHKRYLTTLKVTGVGVFVNGGGQFIVCKRISIEGYLGLGLTINSKEYAYAPPGTAETGDVQNYYAYYKQGEWFPGITGGINVGYVFP